MDKVRVAMIANYLVKNGISNVIMNYCINLDKSKADITIIVGTPVEPYYRELCKKNNIGLIELPSRKKDTVSYYMALFKEFSASKYDIVHVHGNSATITAELLIARLKGIKIRIAHCHNSTCDNIKIHKALLPIFNRMYTYGYACSSLAGDWLFGQDKYDILPNCFDTKKFLFNAAKREQIRKELCLEGKFVIGTVARFNDQKNHPYLLKIFESVAREREDAYLFLVGGGPNLGEIKKQIAEHPYKDRIIYYGETNRVEDIYNIFDVFVLPTKFEGLGIVFIEAQINGLPVVTSNKVPPEVNIGNRTRFIAISENNIEEWKNAIFNAEIIDRTEFFYKHEDEISVYDIKNNAGFLLECYEKMMQT